MKHKYKMLVDLNSKSGSIPVLLIRAYRGVRKHGDSLDIQALWHEIVNQNMSYNEALRYIGLLINIVDVNW